MSSWIIHSGTNQSDCMNRAVGTEIQKTSLLTHILYAVQADKPLPSIIILAKHV